MPCLSTQFWESTRCAHLLSRCFVLHPRCCSQFCQGLFPTLQPAQTSLWKALRDLKWSWQDSGSPLRTAPFVPPLQKCQGRTFRQTGACCWSRAVLKPWRSVLFQFCAVRRWLTLVCQLKWPACFCELNVLNRTAYFANRPSPKFDSWRATWVLFQKPLWDSWPPWSSRKYSAWEYRHRRKNFL